MTRESKSYDVLLHGPISVDALNLQFEEDLELLKSQYVFRDETAIRRFLLGHRAVMPTLSAAISQLRQSFGQDIIPCLEATVDDDGSISLYGIVIWRRPAIDAEMALEDFDNRWWLKQTSQPGLTFTYELA